MLTDLAAALAAAGADVRVVTSRLRYGDASASLPARESIDGVDVHRVRSLPFARDRLGARALDDLAFAAAASLALFRLVRRGDVVVAKTDPPLVLVPAGWVARRCGARIVNWLQDVFPEVAAELGVKLARGLPGRVLRWLRDRALARASANVVVGRLMRERISAPGIDPRNIAVIANWADGAALRPVAPGANPLRVEWGIGDRFVVGYSGNMGRVHELETLLDAAALLAARSDIVFLFVGDGVQKAALVRTAAERGLTNVRFEPYQPRARLGASLSAADVHVVSLHPGLEGLVVPSKFYGIAAVGRPIVYIGDPDGEIGAIVGAADCGLRFVPGDASGLAAGLVALREDPDRRARLGGNARRLFEASYDKPIAVERWRELLARVGAGSAA
jgi:glycosyltransferase involved in cell wall biosynthesis